MSTLVSDDLPQLSSLTTFSAAYDRQLLACVHAALDLIAGIIHGRLYRMIENRKYFAFCLTAVLRARKVGPMGQISSWTKRFARGGSVCHPS
jgi:hypothetical protein